jgi:syndecan 4
VPLQDLSGSPLTQGSEAARLAREKARLRRLRRLARLAAEKAAKEAACGGKDPKCNGHGVCNETLSMCECQDGWGGEHCDFQHCAGYNETAGTPDCNAHGECEDGKCSCAPGWGTPDPKTGVALLEGITEECEARVCPSQCSIHGRCRDGDCICDEGWTGNTCHRVECPNKCSGHGTCAFWAGSDSPGECECFQGYLGGDCSRAEKTMQKCPNNCNGNGLCFDGRCACSDGFRGVDCGDAVCSDPQKLGPECNVERCMNDCQGQGLCFSGTCECWDGYYGDDCGVPRDCMEGCAALCQEDSRVPHCATCLGDCETMLAGDRLGKHAWTEDIHS